MSTAHGPARSRPVRQPEARRPLTVVPRRPAARPRTPFVVLVVALMAVGLVGLLLINTSMQRKAFELTSLQERADTLQKREQALQLDVQRMSSPDRIAAEAGRLGMVPNASPAFLRLEDGEVLGHPRAAMPGTNLPGLSAPPAAETDDEPATDAETDTDRDGASGDQRNGADEGDDRSGDDETDGAADDHGHNNDGEGRNDDGHGGHGDRGAEQR